MCKMVGPEYQRAAWILHNSSLPVKVAQLNADKYTKVADSLGVSKYPSVFLYRNGVPEAFPVLSVAEAYVAGAARMLSLPGADALSPVKQFPLDVEVTDVAAWLFWRGASGGAIPTTVVLYSPPGLSGSAAAAADRVSSAFVEAAQSLFRNPTLRFAQVRDVATLEAFEVPTDRATVVMYKEHDEGRVEMPLPPDGGISVGEFEAWAQVHTVPLATTITHKNLESYRRKVSHMGLLFVDAPAVAHKATAARLQASLLSIAQALLASGVVQRGKFTIGVVDGSKYGGWMEHYGLREGEFPAFGLEETGSESLYALHDIAVEGACSPPEEAAAPPPPAPGTPEFDALPDGYDLVAPYKEVDGRPMHTPAWCPGGGSFEYTRQAARAKAEAAAGAAGAGDTHTSSASVGVDGSVGVHKVTPGGAPLPEGYVPSFTEGFSHDEATVARKLLNDAREAEGLPPLPPVGALLTGGFSDAFFPPLYWVEVPAGVEGWLRSALSGTIPPTRKGKAAAISSYADMAAGLAAVPHAVPVGGDFLEDSQSERRVGA